jgi:hypothetical protein
MCFCRACSYLPSLARRRASSKTSSGPFLERCEHMSGVTITISSVAVSVSSRTKWQRGRPLTCQHGCKSFACFHRFGRFRSHANRLPSKYSPTASDPRVFIPICPANNSSPLLTNFARIVSISKIMIRHQHKTVHHPARCLARLRQCRQEHLPILVVAQYPLPAVPTRSSRGTALPRILCVALSASKHRTPSPSAMSTRISNGLTHQRPLRRLRMGCGIADTVIAYKRGTHRVFYRRFTFQMFERV